MGKFNQLCVWTGTLLGDSTADDFVNFFKENGFDVKFECEYETLQDKDAYGDSVEGTGGRHDILFYINDDDIPKFAIWRLSYGIRWWEDFLDNGHGDIVPQNILEKYPYGW